MKTIGIVVAVLPAIVAIYAYGVYPLLLWAMGARRRPSSDVPEPLVMRPESGARAGGAAPMVTIVVPAHNEEVQIRGAIEALIAQDYPRDRTQILVVSDGSSDRTNDVVAEYSGRVELLAIAKRGGKTAAENASLPRIRGDIVVNTDASTRLHPSAVRHLVDRFADPHVGVASTRDVSVDPAGGAANQAETEYVGYEMWVRSLETRAGGVVGASGSGYAIRATLHRIPIREDLSRDFSAALTACRHGYIAVAVDDALCRVPRTTSLRSEYRRKVRTISRGMHTLLHNRALLDPHDFGLFSVKLLSHKVCRWLVPLLVVPSLVALVLLSASEPIARVLIGGAVVTAALAAIGAVLSSRRQLTGILSFITFATAANVAVIHAAWRVLDGRRDQLWEPTRRNTAVPSASNATGGAGAA